MNSRIVLAAALLVMLCPALGQAEIWNLLDDFSTTENPNGAWSFGWRPTAVEPLNLYTDIQHDTNCPPDPNVCVWNYQLDPLSLDVGKNFNDHVFSCNGCDFPANSVWFHPGPTQQSVVRWTAPVNMHIALAAQFRALDTGSSLVHVYHNGVELFSATLGDIGATADCSLTRDCQAGDIIDIAIDAISFTDDSVQLAVVIGPAVGVCCFSTGACLQGTQADCEAAGGNYEGDEVTCDSDPCEPILVRETTWSQVKSLYR